MEAEIISEEGFEYIERGEGEPIIVLHGLFGALSNFEDVFDHFSKKYKVLIPMLPIYTLPILNTNVKNIANYLHDFIKFKGFLGMINSAVCEAEISSREYFTNLCASVATNVKPSVEN